MPAGVKLRDDYRPTSFRALAGRSKDTNQSRRLLSLAAVRGGVGRGGGGQDRRHGIARPGATGRTASTPRGRTGLSTTGPPAARQRACRRSSGPSSPSLRRPGRAGPRSRRRRALAARRSRARHRRALGRLVSRAHGRKAPQEARIFAHERAAASPCRKRADRRSVQKNFPRAMKAHFGDASPRPQSKSGFRTESRFGQKNGLVRQRASGSAASPARRSTRRQCLSARRYLTGAGRRRRARAALCRH